MQKLTLVSADAGRPARRATSRSVAHRVVHKAGRLREGHRSTVDNTYITTSTLSYRAPTLT